MKRVVVVPIVEDIPLVDSDECPRVDRWIMSKWFYCLLNWWFASDEKLNRVYRYNG